MEGFAEVCGTLEDPRSGNAKRHLLLEILMIGLRSVPSGGGGCAEMALFGRAKERFPRRVLTLPHGIPARAGSSTAGPARAATSPGSRHGTPTQGSLRGTLERAGRDDAFLAQLLARFAQPQMRWPRAGRTSGLTGAQGGSRFVLAEPAQLGNGGSHGAFAPSAGGGAWSFPALFAAASDGSLETNVSDDDKPTRSSALVDVDKAIDLIYDLGKVLQTSWNLISNKVRPDYASCADGFYRIAKLLRSSTWELESLLRSLLYLPVDVLDKSTIEAKVAELLRGNTYDVVSRVRFRCGDIDSIYQSQCRSWFQSFLGLQNPVATQFADRHRNAEQILLDLTRIDAQLIYDLTEKIVDPLKKFQEKIRRARTDKEVVEQYEKLRPSLMKNLDVIVEHLRKLDEAVVAFAKLAGRPVSLDKT